MQGEEGLGLDDERTDIIIETHVRLRPWKDVDAKFFMICFCKKLRPNGMTFFFSG
jgi:hypothetical protein